ncbi:MAG TPA: DNA mismatch repair endonuclease MutL [Proteiniclasticum sp.]|uniref:DNA mismatch repair endonuclease MutL n=1 Tax=Proteiniclasticum sp. TaxID=2053595 RepID=UPI000E8E8B54|nr:DNA mismatch repair endonuclease MutL [Proteiniclasticum sp.]HBW13455.1 DNA mismatch repair endonuclease MutL [Proteiniclasticum sp.]
MGKINLLTKDTFNKIAAGEVVERPASVVKELVENSIDAGATEIYVEIQSGGEELIKIVDNGEGILEEDLRNAFLPHATSKISTADDLFSIHTMGFRGEALSSIASVSKILTRSKTKEQDGREILIEGGEIRYEKYSSMDQGTLMEIRDLFYNVPARKKFLKTPSREGAIISEIVSKISMAHPSISFRLVVDGKEMLRTYGTGNQKDVIRQVYSKKVHDHVFYFENHFDSFSIFGFIGHEEISRGSRAHETIFVNKRLVQSKVITTAAEKAFKSFATVSRFPFFVINIEIFPELIDVNIHPQKAEIKFEDDAHIFKSVFGTIHQSLREGLQETFRIQEEEEPDRYEQLRQPETEPVRIDIPLDLTKDPRVLKIEEDRKALDAMKREGTIRQQESVIREPYEELKPDAVSPLRSEEYTVKPTAKFPMPRIIGQFRATYILTEIQDELYIFDQHAAHEKINFEKYMEEIRKGHVAAQGLLIPEILDLSMDDYQLYLENKEVLKEAGFLLEEFGDRSVAIREVPIFLGKTEAAPYFHEILDNIRNLGKGSKEEVKYLRIATAACKASIKAYEELTMEEMRHLIETLRFIEEPFSCPHGRPTLVKLTEKDMQKMFRRIV